ncbi:BTAD domain-containing putative transcriptional regulator [Glycomyces sp. NPDC047010]|uniref:AfsR/SARP family transcriptional regulator n=1 Tax=Glycomyces sp. NPDC047010 TaxID=3155023 RepID=UPI0033BFD491
MAAETVKFRALGPLELAVGGRAVTPRGAKPRALLALLLLDVNRVCERDLLIDRLWAGRPPEGAKATLRAYVYQLRKELGRFENGVVLDARGGGYALEVATEAVDAHRFEALAAEGRRLLRGGGSEAAAAAFREGLGLWRGAAFAGIDVPAVRDKARLLDELRMEATEECLGAELESGAVAVSELEHLTAAHPLREGMWRLLMLALYRSGRQAEALEAYRRLFRLLDGELGVKPSPQVERLHRQILDADPDLQRPGGSVRVRTVPRQLPAPPAHFTGREAQLSEMDELLASPDAPVAVVSGTAGVGKTAFAVHWAHRASERFPDGQLYVNLRGFDPVGQPVAPGEAVRSLLSALGTAPETVPGELDAQIGLYRSALADKRVLLVLDNARDAAQVRPLLPGGRGTAAVVTSRDRLSGLVAHGAQPIGLRQLGAAESGLFLERRLRKRRTAAEPEAAAQIAADCAGLPLALAVVTARAAGNPHFALAALARELREAARRLDALADPDPAADVRAVFSWSYRALSPGAAKMFRLLGTHPGPDFTAAAAASLAGTGAPPAHRLLDELERASLLYETSPGRFAFHDLVHAYAADLAAQDKDREDAVLRTLDHYLRTAYAGMRLIQPIQDAITLAPAPPGAAPEPLADGRAAMAWFGAERDVLLALVEHAAALGLDGHCWQLAWAASEYLHRAGHWHDLARSWETVRARTGPHTEGEVMVRVERRLAFAYSLLDRFEEAHELLDRSLEQCRDLGNPGGEGHVHQLRGYVWRRQGKFDAAIECNRRALELYRAAEHQGGQAIALNSIGWHRATVDGAYLEALADCEAALGFAEAADDRAGQAAILDSLGYVHHHLGRFDLAVDHYERSVDLSRDVGARSGEAAALANLADTHLALNDPDAARDAWTQALEILDDIAHPDADSIRAKLAGLDD